MKQITYPEEFDYFFAKMKMKMLKAHEKKGDSWKGCSLVWLRRCLKNEVTEYFEDLNPEELIDIADFCAMLYLRANKHTNKTS